METPFFKKTHFVLPNKSAPIPRVLALRAHTAHQFNHAAVFKLKQATVDMRSYMNYFELIGLLRANFKGKIEKFSSVRICAAFLKEFEIF